MEMTDIMTDLINAKACLEVADNVADGLIRQNKKLKNKCIRKNLLIAGLVWFGATACKMLGESDKKRREAEEEARNLHTTLLDTQRVLEEVNRAHAEQFWAENSAGEPEPEKDICCDGKASVTKRPE